MGFLKKIFGSSGQDNRPTSGSSDSQGIYFYVQCDRCGAPVRLRADKQYDLINESGGYVWHKTIVDSRCFRPMPTVVYLNSAYEVTSHEITGGRYITREEYEALLTPTNTLPSEP
ncbi:MAG: hypothetical protein DCC51_07840 [Anaerolineae bacterium]|nr:MAG: hypothetical protein DCC51_07840 [Anaerolineae bacterium]